MTTYGRGASFPALRSKIDELDMLINSFECSEEDDSVAQLKELRGQLAEMLDNLEKTFGSSKQSLTEMIIESGNRPRKNQKGRIPKRQFGKTPPYLVQTHSKIRARRPDGRRKTLLVGRLKK